MKAQNVKIMISKQVTASIVSVLNNKIMLNVKIMISKQVTASMVSVLNNKIMLYDKVTEFEKL